MDLLKYGKTKRWIMSLGSLNYLNKDVQTPMLNRVMSRYNRVVDADCKELKENHDIEPYLRRNISCTLRITFTKMRLSSRKLLVERGRWVKPKINYCDRLCTLCHKHDIQDEYHALMICSRYESLRKKYLKPYYYKRPSVYKFIQLMNTVNKREQFR